MKQEDIELLEHVVRALKGIATALDRWLVKKKEAVKTEPSKRSESDH